MNFEYEESKEPVKIPVAFIAPNGNFVIKATDDYYGDSDDVYAIFDPSSKTVIVERGEYGTDYSPFDEDNKKLFYVGDKITITF